MFSFSWKRFLTHSMSLQLVKSHNIFYKNIIQLSNFLLSGSFHSCCILNKKKNKFVNPYIKQYDPKINNDYVEDHLMKTHVQAIFNLDESPPNFEQAILQEAQHKHKMYKRSKKYKDLSGRKRLKLPPLSFEQIQHIKHLNSENPDMWNPNFLAMSFNLEIDQVKAVLKNKQKESDLFHDNDFKASPTQSAVLPAIASANLLPPNSESNEKFLSFQESESKESDWFVSFNEVESQEKSLVEINSIDEIEDNLRDEIYEDEHYEIFETFDDEDFDNEQYNDEELSDEEINDEELSDMLNNDFNESKQRESITVQSSDNCNFYDNEGRFLYKLYKS